MLASNYLSHLPLTPTLDINNNYKNVTFDVFNGLITSETIHEDIIDLNFDSLTNI